MEIANQMNLTTKMICLNSSASSKIIDQHPKEVQEKSLKLSCESINFETPLLKIPSVEKTFLKMIQFIQYHNIKADQIWKDKIELSIQQFTNFLNENYGYKFSNEELNALLKLSAKKEQALRIKNFSPLKLWIGKSYCENQSQFIQAKKFETLNSKRLQMNQKKIQKSQPLQKTDQQIQNQFCRSSPQATQTKSLIELKKSNSRPNFSEVKMYNRYKIKSKVQELKKDIRQSVLQKKWDFIVMAGEMNQWLQKNRQKIPEKSQNHNQALASCLFKVINKNSIEIIQQNLETGTEEVIPHVVFIKKYETLKQKMIKAENNKNNLKGTVLMVLEDNDKFSKNNLLNRINQRDQQLNVVLQDIIKMKSLFKWQSKILKQAKINS